MKPASFEYIAPDSLAEALSAMQQHGWDAKALAGGQSLIPTMNFRLAQPTVLVDLNGVTELAGISPTPSGGLRISAMTRQRTIEHSPLVASHTPLLAEAIPYVAHPQIRNRGTIGGSLVHADPASELPVVAVALDAMLEIQGNAGIRQTPATDFFQGIFAVDLEPEELLTAIEFPTWDTKMGFAFLEVARRHGDYALAGVTAIVGVDNAGNCNQCRLVYLSVGDKPTVAVKAGEAMLNNPPTKAAITETAHIASSEEISPAGNIHATADYQRHLANVLTQRALHQAFQRATA